MVSFPLLVAGSGCGAAASSPSSRPPRAVTLPAGADRVRLGDALALVAACVVAAVRWHGRAEADLEALAGWFGLAAALAPAPGS